MPSASWGPLAFHGWTPSSGVGTEGCRTGGLCQDPLRDSTVTRTPSPQLPPTSCDGPRVHPIHPICHYSLSTLSLAPLSSVTFSMPCEASDTEDAGRGGAWKVARLVSLCLDRLLAAPMQARRSRCVGLLVFT